MMVPAGTEGGRNDAPSSRNARKNRLYILIGGAIVIVFALAFAQLSMAAIQVRKQTSDVFQQWVIQHHVGSAQLVTDSSGFDGTFMVLTVTKPVADSQIAAESLMYMKEYYSLDGGQTLNIQARDTGTNKAQQIASVQYIEAAHTVYINVHEGSDAGQTLQRKVSWRDVPDSTD